ncbi:MAG: tetratricopeptide repeat protein [Cyanobacteria bacterium P01_H01_bin.74]
MTVIHKIQETIEKIGKGQLAGCYELLHDILAKKEALTDENYVLVYLTLALFHKRKGAFEKALVAIGYAGRRVEEKPAGISDETKINLLTLNGTLEREMGNGALARFYFAEALLLWKAQPDLDESNLMIPLNNLAGAHMDLKENIQAEACYAQALAISNRLYGKLNPDTIQVQINMGEFYRQTGQAEKALRLLESALETIDQEGIGLTREFFPLFNNLGALYMQMGKYTLSCEVFELGAKILEQSEQKMHPDLATLYHNLGCLYRDLGALDKALVFFNQCLFIRKNRLGESHYLTAMTLSNLGLLYILKNDLKKAHQILKKAKRLTRSALGDSHPDYAVVCNNIGEWAKAAEKFELAIQYYHKAKSIYLETEMQPNIQLMINLLNIANCYCKLRQYKTALTYLDQVALSKKQIEASNNGICPEPECFEIAQSLRDKILSGPGQNVIKSTV